MPLDIETVVEKYVALGSDATFVSNLRRHGIGPAGIEKALNQRRALRGDDADRVSQIEQFRSELSNKGRVGLIDSYVSLFGSHERVIPLWEATVDEPPEVFWPVWLEWWNMCDGIESRLPRGLLLETFRSRSRKRTAFEFHRAEDREFLESLSYPLTRSTSLPAKARLRVSIEIFFGLMSIAASFNRLSLKQRQIPERTYLGEND